MMSLPNSVNFNDSYRYLLKILATESIPIPSKYIFQDPDTQKIICQMSVYKYGRFAGSGEMRHEAKLDCASKVLKAVWKLEILNEVLSEDVSSFCQADYSVKGIPIDCCPTNNSDNFICINWISDIIPNLVLIIDTDCIVDPVEDLLRERPNLAKAKVLKFGSRKSNDTTKNCRNFFSFDGNCRDNGPGIIALSMRIISEKFADRVVILSSNTTLQNFRKTLKFTDIVVLGNSSCSIEVYSYMSDLFENKVIEKMI